MSDTFVRQNTADQEKKLDAESVQHPILGELFRLRMVSPDKSQRIDEVSATLLYIGEAVIGALDTDPVWKIKKILTSGSQTAILWPDDGNGYVHSWADRASLTYV